MQAHQVSSPSVRGSPTLTHTFRPPVERQTDWVNPGVLAILAVTGVFFIKSAQSFSGGGQWAQQMVWLALGAAIYVAVSSLDYHFWAKNALWVYLGSVVLLLLLWSPLGEVRSGARRWLGVGSTYTIQPSEFAKIGALIMVANVLGRAKVGNLQTSLTVLGQVGLVMAAPIVLIFLQPDLGSSLVLFPTVFALLYVSKLPARFFVAVFGIFLVVVAVLGVDTWKYEKYLQANQVNHVNSAAADAKPAAPEKPVVAYEKISLIPLKDYQRNRILAFLDPSAVDKNGVGVAWNQNQSLIAVGTGGLFGKGYENGTQARLGYLPTKVVTSDFIMSVFLEETGFVGGMAILGLYAILLGNTLRIAGLARDRFGRLLCVGVAVIFMVHVFVNIGMVQGLMPVKGIPLPLMSYGGSFVLSCCLLMGLVQSVYRHRREAV